MPFLFEKLEVYQKALALPDRVAGMTAGLPRGCWYLADQLKRASLSISLNIAEGNGRWTQADRKNFFGIARGSVHECVPLIELCRRRGILQDEVCDAPSEELETIAKMLSGLIRRTQRPSSAA